VCQAGRCSSLPCQTDSECQAQGDLICNDSHCGPAECSGDDDCTVQYTACQSGRCLDPVLYCFDEMPPLSSDDPGELTVTLIQYLGKTKVQNLQVKVCSLLDTTCSKPIDAKTSYADDGKLVISGLANNQRYSIRFTGKDDGGEDLLETEYYMERPVVGKTVEADSFEMIPPYLVPELASTAGTMVDMTKAIVLAQVFGCDNKPLAGVSATDSRQATLFYLAGTTNPDAMATDSTGQVGWVNMEVSDDGAPRQHQLSFTYKGQTMYTFNAAPRPGVLTFLFMYLPDYGTAISRGKTLTR
jgi:hypothetical protein